MADVLQFACPRCGTDVTLAFYGPCPDCRTVLRRIYADRNRVRIASIAHMQPEEYNVWLITPNDALDGDTPWSWIDAGFTDQIIDLVKQRKRERAAVD